jgi:3-phosphoshikimate 1-carboxyvinyltransferase
MSRQVITPAKRLAGELRVPGDKSISHRALLISAVGEGPCLISGSSAGEDVEATRGAIETLGVVISHSYPHPKGEAASGRELDREILVEGRGWEGLAPSPDVIFCQNSGTTARTLLGVLAGRPFEARLDGDASLRRRPMARVIEPLRSMGAAFEAEADEDRLPLRIVGGALTGIDHRSLVASAQVKTAVLLAGLQAGGRTSFAEPARSRDHTERLLEYLKVPIARETDRLIVKSTNIRNPSSLSVPGDLSSAAFLLVAAAILPGSEVTVRGVGLNPTRTGILDALRRFGAEVRIDPAPDESGEPLGDVTVKARDRLPVRVDGAEVVRTIDELPLIAVLGAFAEGETVIADAAELRIKESDRISALAAGLRTLGVDVRTAPDGMTVSGPATIPGGATVDAAGDHRIAMALAVAALAGGGDPTLVEGWESVGVSYPGFASALQALVEP